MGCCRRRARSGALLASVNAFVLDEYRVLAGNSPRRVDISLVAGKPAQIRPAVVSVLRAHGVEVDPVRDSPYYFDLFRRDPQHPILLSMKLPDIVHWDTLDNLRFSFNIPIEQFYAPRKKLPRRRRGSTASKPQPQPSGPDDPSE